MTEGLAPPFVDQQVEAGVVVSLNLFPYFDAFEQARGIGASPVKASLGSRGMTKSRPLMNA